MSRKKPETGAGLRGDWGSPELGQKEIRIQTVRIVKQEMENFRFMKIYRCGRFLNICNLPFP